MSVGVQVGELGGGYVTRHIDPQLTPREAQTVQRVLSGLIESRATPSDGRFVQKPPDVVRRLAVAGYTIGDRWFSSKQRRTSSETHSENILQVVSSVTFAPSFRNTSIPTRFFASFPSPT